MGTHHHPPRVGFFYISKANSIGFLMNAFGQVSFINQHGRANVLRLHEFLSREEAKLRMNEVNIEIWIDIIITIMGLYCQLAAVYAKLSFNFNFNLHLPSNITHHAVAEYRRQPRTCHPQRRLGGRSFPGWASTRHGLSFRIVYRNFTHAVCLLYVEDIVEHPARAQTIGAHHAPKVGAFIHRCPNWLNEWIGIIQR